MPVSISHVPGDSDVDLPAAETEREPDAGAPRAPACAPRPRTDSLQGEEVVTLVVAPVVEK